MPSRTLVIVGLGNPGAGYARTRHNAGAMVVDALAGVQHADLRRRRGQVRSADSILEARPVILAVPTTFMNESGRPVAGLVRKAGARPQDLIVCHDELDLPLGRVRLKAGGGTGGHRGLESIEASLRSRDFVRLRLGIGRPPSGVDPVRHVLTSFSPDERPVMEQSVELAMQGLRILVREGLDAAQNFLHAPPLD